MPQRRVSSPSTTTAGTVTAATARATAATVTAMMMMLDPQVLHDLAVAVLDDLSDYHDTFLMASDGVQVAACRFVLAARSPVLKKMLYGNFREAQSSTIGMVDYDSGTLQAVVDYCSTNTLTLKSHNGDGDKSSNGTSNYIEQLVQVYNAADFLDLKGLATLAEREIRKTMSARPALACLVLNQAVTDSPVSQYALQMIEVRPYVALDNSSSSSSACSSSNGGTTGGGVECLQPEWLLYIMKSQSIAAGEFFLFYMLNRWYEHHVKIIKDNNDKRKAAPSTVAAGAVISSRSPLDVAYQCAKYIQFDNIEPQILLDDALQRKCPWMSPSWIFEAVAKQALRASQDRIWSVQCRGGGFGVSAGVDVGGIGNTISSSASTSFIKSRILVEGAGNPNANGIYYLSISGLTRGGDLYSKREIAVGQEYVYTLSCRLAPTNNDDNNNNDVSNSDASTPTTSAAMVECHIFCSKLLSHAAISTLHDIQQFNRIRGHLDPVFQPILQILSVDAPVSPSTASSSSSTNQHHHHATSLHDTFYRVQVSDGDWTMSGTLAHTPHLRDLIQRGELVENSIIQVLDFGLYLTNSSNDTNGGSNSSNNNNNNTSCCCLHIQRVSIVNANPGQEFGNPKPFVYQGANGNTDNSNSSVSTGSYGEHGGIQSLYTCTYPLDRQAKDTKIPRTGWLVAEHGQGPSPTCTWIPGIVRRDTGATSPTGASTVISSSSGSGASVATAPTSNIREDAISLSSMGLAARR